MANLPLTELTSASAIPRGGGSTRKLTAAPIPALIAQRMYDPEWFAHYWNGSTHLQVGAAAAGADVVFAAIGTNAADGNMTWVTDATIGTAQRLATAGADLDQALVVPNGASSWGSVATTWDTDQQPGIFATIATSTAAVSFNNARIILGLKLTSSGAGATAPATDADQAIWYADANNTTTAPNWRIQTSVNSADEDRDSGATIAATTVYQLGVFLDVARRPHYYWNGQLHHVGPALRSLATLEPTFGIEEATSGGSAKHLYVRNAFVCQRYMTAV